MSPDELQQYLWEHIPLSQAMQASAEEVGEESVVLSAPLAPNINHRETIFGGSASALAILSAWSLLHVRLRAAGIECRLVIQRNTMEYRQPIQGRFRARATLAEPSSWETFVRMLARHGKARIRVASILEYRNRIVGEFNGEFVALGALETPTDKTPFA